MTSLGGETPENGQVFAVDLRAQGFGLADHAFLDGAANKFLLLAGKEDVYISPSAVPGVLLDYYQRLELNVPSTRIFTVTSAVGGVSLAEQIADRPDIKEELAQRRGGALVPYLATGEMRSLAAEYGMRTLADPQVVDYLADKEHFQKELATVAPAIEAVTGLNVAVKHGACWAGDRETVQAIYDEHSQGGRKKVVVVRPKSASALGIFVLNPERGVDGLEAILGKHFNENERVLVEEFVPHNQSPSAQGLSTDESYRHLYFGNQFISIKGTDVTYDGNEIPFGPETVFINTGEMERLQAVHQVLGEQLVQANRITGVAGFDFVMQLAPNSMLEAVKATEMNLHLPGSYAVYAATQKVFPSGFSGIAHNVRVPLQGLSREQFMFRNNDLLVQRQGGYGIFPINMSYTDKVDVVFFAKNVVHLEALKRSIRT